MATLPERPPSQAVFAQTGGYEIGSNLQDAYSGRLEEYRAEMAEVLQVTPEALHLMGDVEIEQRLEAVQKQLSGTDQ